MKPFAMLLMCFGLFAGASADTFDDIMAAHRKALQQAKVSGSMRDKVEKLDAGFVKTMRESLDEIVKTPKSSPRHDALVTKMRQDTSDYKADLKKTLGDKWNAYQRVYATLMPSPVKGAKKASEPSKNGSKSKVRSGKSSKGA
jgi:uncharacterized GH25 family protein